MAYIQDNATKHGAIGMFIPTLYVLSLVIGKGSLKFHNIYQLLVAFIKANFTQARLYLLISKGGPNILMVNIYQLHPLIAKGTLNTWLLGCQKTR